MSIGPASSIVIVEDTNGDDHQIVPEGRLGVLRAFSCTYSVITTGTGYIEFRNGTSSGTLVFKYAPPSRGMVLNWGRTDPTILVEVPGIGIRFDDGINLKFVISGTATLCTEILYT